MQLVATKSEAISATMLRFISSYVAECLVDGAMPVHQSLTGCRISLESIVDVEGVLMPTTTGVRYTTISTIELSIQRLYVVSYAQPLPFSLEQQPSISVGRQHLSLMLRVRLLRDMDPTCLLYAPDIRHRLAHPLRSCSSIQPSKRLRLCSQRLRRRFERSYSTVPSPRSTRPSSSVPRHLNRSGIRKPLHV